MKKLIIISILTLGFSTAAFSWGGTGHSAVAQVAEYHLSKKAKKALDVYLEGKTLHEVASDGDKYRHEWTVDLGREISNPNSFRFKKWGDKFNWDLPTNIEPYPHSFTATADFQPVRELFEIRDGQNYGLTNCVYYVDKYIKELKEGYKTMDPKERSIKLRMLIHWLGDMHCPGHCSIQNPKDKIVHGTNPITVRGKKTTYHKFWDGGIFTHGLKGKKFLAVAQMADGYNDVKFPKKGYAIDPWGWAEDAAKISYSTKFCNGELLVKGQDVPDEYPDVMVPVCLTQIRNGGYRLASVLNYIFK